MSTQNTSAFIARAIELEEKKYQFKASDYHDVHASIPGSISRPNFYEIRRIGCGIKAAAFLHRAISSLTSFHRQFLQISHIPYTIQKLKRSPIFRCTNNLYISGYPPRDGWISRGIKGSCEKSKRRTPGINNARVFVVLIVLLTNRDLRP